MDQLAKNPPPQPRPAATLADLTVLDRSAELCPSVQEPCRLADVY
ncbi:hypothetical protein [Kitasatospora aureofaciens]